MATVRERILARPDLLGLRGKRDLDGLAAALNAEGYKEVASRFVTTRTIMDECGTLDDGRSIVSALKNAATLDPLAAEALGFLRDDSGFDVGKAKTRAYIDAMVPASLSAERAAMLKDLALRPVVVTRLDVESAMFNPDGTEK